MRRDHATLVVAALFAAACAPGREGAERTLVESTTRAVRVVVVDGVEYEMSLGELGVVVDPSQKGEDDLVDMTSTGDAIVRYTPDHWVVPLPGEGRDQVVGLAIQARIQLDGFVRDAGPVLRLRGSETPYILGRRVVVTFAEGVDAERARTLIEAHGGLLVRRFPDDPYTYSVDVDIHAPGIAPPDSLRVAEALRELPEVEAAEPMLIVPVVDYGTAADPLLGKQWHHFNDVLFTKGTEDADVDTPEAWAIEDGSPGVVIAVLDSGFQDDHHDLVAKRWVNPGEHQPGNGQDDDGNNYADDFHGWNFEVGPNASVAQNDFHERPHGTSVAGLAGAERGNSYGGAGTCPECPLMFVQRGLTPDDHHASIHYAVNNGAEVLNLSWGYKGVTELPGLVVQALDHAELSGASVVVAMNNAFVIDECDPQNPRLGAHPTVISVSGSDPHDRKAQKSFGDCTDVLAPVEWRESGVMIGIASTDLTGAEGYNHDLAQTGCTDVTLESDTACFSGNSAAAPIVAGIVGLIRSARPGTSPKQVRALLRDTADRIDPLQAGYRRVDGRGEVVHPFYGGSTLTSLHGSGRVNAFEAVRVVASPASGGRGGVDVFVRDNFLDWGNTERPSNHLFKMGGGYIAHWKSEDIRVDAPPYGMPANPSPADFEAFQSEDPVSLALNHVYVRVRNRGPVTATEVKVRLLRASASAGLPLLPSNYKGPGPLGAGSGWSLVGDYKIGSLKYSGSSVAGGPLDVAAVARFDFLGPQVDTTQPASRHHCLMAVVQAPADPVSVPSLIPDVLTPRDNNVTHRNVKVRDPALQLDPVDTRFEIHNPFGTPASFRIRVDGPAMSSTLDLSELGMGVLTGTRTTAPFDLGSGASATISARLIWPVGVTGDVDFIQERLDGETWEPLGGWTVSTGP